MTKRWRDTTLAAILALPLWSYALHGYSSAQIRRPQDGPLTSNISSGPAAVPQWQPLPASAEEVVVGPPQSAGVLQPALPMTVDFSSSPASNPNDAPALALPDITPFSEAQPPWAAAMAPQDSLGLMTPIIDQGAVPFSSRPPVIFRPAVPSVDPLGQPILRPSVWLGDSSGTEILPSFGTLESSTGLPSQQFDLNRPRSLEELDLQSILAGDEAAENVWAAPQVSRQTGGGWGRGWSWFSSFFHGRRGPLRGGYDIGVGRERLPFALSEIDSSQPLNNVRLRFDAAYDWEYPDRAEFLWAKAGGPGPAVTDPSVDYQDIRMLMEMGGPKFSVGTEIPLRFLNPTVLGNTAGLGDMAVTTKTVMIDGDSWQLTQILRTQMNTGTPKAGRGNGHISMEPGLIARYKWRPDTYLHSELKFLFPLGGSPGFAGEVLRYGFGLAHVYYENDTFAVIPTLEFVGWSVLSGQKTIDAFGITQTIDGENIFNIHPGVRLVNDSAGDFGMFEVGLSSGLSVTESHWYRELLRMDLRWSF